MFCPHCGSENENGTLFCTKCGKRLSEENTHNENSRAGRNIDMDDTMIMKPVKMPEKHKAYDEGPVHSKNAERISERQSVKKSSAKPKENTDDTEGKKGLKIAVIILSVCLAIMFITLLVFGIKIFSGNNDNTDGNGDTTSVQQQNNEDDKKDKSEVKDSKDEDIDEEMPKTGQPESSDSEDKSYSTIPVDSVYASTERSTEETSFSAKNATDSKLSTAWSPESHNGSGESITLCFDSTRKVHGIKISNGYALNSSEYSLNNRLKRITVKFSDGNICTAELKDNVLSMQTVEFGSETECTSLTVYIDSVYSSTAEDSYAYISEIEVF